MQDDGASKDLYEQEVERLLPLVKAFQQKAAFMRHINFAATALSPLAAVMLSEAILPVNQAILAASLCGAVTTQITRWQKANMKREFNHIWEQAPLTQPLLQTNLKHTFDKEVDKSTLIVSREDFNLRHRTVAITLAGTAVIGATYLPMAPVMFFTGMQARVFGDSMKIAEAAQHALTQYERHAPTRSIS